MRPDDPSGHPGPGAAMVNGYPARGGAVLEIYSPDFSRRILLIVQGKGYEDRLIPVGERALWWLERYLHHVRPEILAAPDCRRCSWQWTV